MTKGKENTYEKIIFEEMDEVAWITFSDEKRYNCMSMTLLDEFVDALEWIEVNDAIKCVVITGGGDKAFSSGADFTMFPTLCDALAGYNFLRNYLYRLMHLITNTEKVFIAAINGVCWSGGMEVSLCCDFRIASERATIAVKEIDFGLVPGGGGMARLSKLLPMSKAKELIMTGDVISAHEAYRLFIFDKVVPHEELYDAVNELTEKICSKPFLAVRMIKTGVDKIKEVPGMEAVLAIERGVEMGLTASEDFKEGLSAFVEKRPPKWKGR